jgi:hypothetical protein
MAVAAAWGRLWWQLLDGGGSTVAEAAEAWQWLRQRGNGGGSMVVGVAAWQRGSRVAVGGSVAAGRQQ